MINQISKSLLILAVGGLIFYWFRDYPNHNNYFHFGRRSGRGRFPAIPRVNQVNGREANPQGRIANGVKNGSPSRKQTSNLEKR